MKLLTALLFFTAISFSSAAQRLLTDVLDTSTLDSRKLKIISQNFGNLSFSGYMQPQFQVAQEKGTDAQFQGGAFAENASNRFRLRRGRLRANYISYDNEGYPSTYFVFQFDGTEQGVNIRDFWGRYYENKLNLFSVTAGVMARPFGFEVQLSSSERESAERGRMSQTLMKNERDIGVEVSINPRKAENNWKNFQIDLALYNGQGLSGPQEFDNRKDIVSRISVRPAKIPTLGNMAVGGGVSALLGGIASETNELFSMQKINNVWQMQSSVSDENEGKIAARNYYGADIEIESPSKKWKSEFRAEYIFGQQTGTAENSSTPGSYPVEDNRKQPLYTRPFNGAYFYFIQNILPKNQLVFKYDWYDPNTRVSGMEINNANGFTAADIRYNTFGFGFLRHVNQHLKILLWYDHIKNETTNISGFEKDVRDNIFTLRTQFMF